MRLVVLLGSLVGGVASIVLMVASPTVTGDPTGSGLAGQPPPSPLAYLTGLLMLVGGVAIFWFSILATVTLGLAAAIGVGLGVMGDSQDQLMFGILALFLSATAAAIVLREGKRREPISQAD